MDITALAAARSYTDNKVKEIINGGDASVVDPTLSLSGAAADAKVTGDRISLLENYITPQMFGAVGDGVADDTDAVQATLDNGGLIYFPAGRYKTTRLLTASKSCRIEMFKPYPQTYKKEYPLTPEDNWMGARIDTYSPEGGMIIGDGVEVDGLFIKAFNGFAGVLLKFDNTIGKYTYPSTARLKHIKLEIDPDSYDNIFPTSMFDFMPDGSYCYVLEDIVIGRGGYCEYGFRTDLSQTSRKWCNNVTIRNLCIDIFAKYPLYVAGAPAEEGGVGAGYWVFDGLAIQAYTYANTVNVVTLKTLGYLTFISAHIWDLRDDSYSNEIISTENLAYVSVVGCGPEFEYLDSYFTPWMKRPENLNITKLEMSVEDNADGTANTLTLSDGTNEKTVNIPKVEMADEQIGNAIGTWMDANAQPKEVTGKNRFNYADPDCITGFFYQQGDGSYTVTTTGTTTGTRWVTGYIEARTGDIIRISKNGGLSVASRIGFYNSKYEILNVFAPTYATDRFGVEITTEDTAFVRFEFYNNGVYEERANLKFCVTINNADVTYEDYYTELVGGIGSFMALQSPNGEKYTLAVTDDGSVISKDEDGNLIIPEKPYVTPQQFGAKANGETDDTEAIQSMFDTVAGVGKVYFPYGNYLTTAPITVEAVPDIEMDGVIMSNHAGAALDLGTNTSTIIDKTIKVKIKKKGTKYEEGSVGLLLHSAARNTFYLDTVNNFETNVKLLSVDKGIWFNTFHLNNLNYAKYGLYLDGSNNGWINDNLFIGGSISVDSDNTAITINHGSSNVFLKQGLEGAGTCVHIIYGSLNSFMQSRCERAIRGLVIDDGKENIMQSNYAKPEFVNNSRYTTNGIIRPGVHGVCQHPSVSVGRLEDDKFLKCGDRIVPTYCQMINATSGTVLEDLPSNSFFFENGVWDAVNYRPVFVFDTTKNKKFEFGGNKTPVCINLYNANGKIVLAEEDIPQYVKADQITVPKWNTNFGGSVYLNASYGFEVSEEVIRIELVYLDSSSGIGGIANFDIRTEYPCYPIRDKILTVPSIPSNGYLGAEIIYNGNLYVYNGTEWKRDDYALTEEDKTEIAEQAASLIDTSLLSILGDGVIE